MIALPLLKLLQRAFYMAVGHSQVVMTPSLSTQYASLTIKYPQCKCTKEHVESTECGRNTSLGVRGAYSIPSTLVQAYFRGVTSTRSAATVTRGFLLIQPFPLQSIRIHWSFHTHHKLKKNTQSSTVP